MTTPAREYPPAYEYLQQLLKEANYDAALEWVERSDLREILAKPPSDVRSLRFRCMVADVYDYGGHYEDAARTILSAGKDAEERILEIKASRYLGDDHAFEKQRCWAVMMRGMCLYRGLENHAPDYETAMRLFQLARTVLELIQDAGQESCLGTLARAWYCTGLVERQNHEYRAARRAFRHSIELAGRGINEPGSAADSFDYNIARCYGLGIGWIAYNGARLDEAAGALVIARRLMASKRAKFISAYIDVVHASIMLSESMAPSRIQEAITLLSKAVQTFLPEKGAQHVSYALRARNELAHAYLRLAIVGGEAERGKNLRAAEGYVDTVKAETQTVRREMRTYWMATITEARILRVRGDFATGKEERGSYYQQAFELTKRAKDEGSAEKFTLIDACIGMGEAAMKLEPPNYRIAIEAFHEALKAAAGSRKASAVAYLHLCRAYLEDNQPSRAVEHFKLWEVMEPNIENAFIADMAQKVQKLLTHVFPPFVLKKEDLLEQGSYKIHINALRRWLAETAVAIEDDKIEPAARRLKNTPEAVRQWLQLRGEDSSN